jgi:multimeric flavodoxin WrbA
MSGGNFSKARPLNTVVLFGSPRLNGTTSKLLDAYVNAIPAEHRSNVKVFCAYKLNVGPCTGCKGCRESGRCVLKDDMTEIYSSIEKADVLIIATPVYNLSFPAPLKAVIDRLQPYWEKLNSKGYVQTKNKKGVALISLGDRAFNNRGFFAILNFIFPMLGADEYREFYAELTDLPEGEKILKDCCDAVRSHAIEIYSQ